MYDTLAQGQNYEAQIDPAEADQVQYSNEVFPENEHLSAGNPEASYGDRPPEFHTLDERVPEGKITPLREPAIQEIQSNPAENKIVRFIATAGRNVVAYRSIGPEDSRPVNLN